MIWDVRVGDAAEVLRTLPDKIVQTCITSPPYYRLRDYGMEGQIGLEETPQAYVERLVEVFREVRRVLRDDGTLWVVLGDSYAGSWGNQGRKAERGAQRAINGPMLSQVLDGRYPSQESNTGRIAPESGFKAKDRMLMPAQVALALRDDGWYLRDEIVWHKTAPMPSSVKDRTTPAHEMVYMLSKSKHYFYDHLAVREDSVSGHPSGNGYKRPSRLSYANDDGSARGQDDQWEPTEKRNRRSVWTLGSEPFGGWGETDHFALFPSKLVEPMVLAGSSPVACGVCGAPWRPVVRSVERDAEVKDASAQKVATTVRPDRVRHAASEGEDGGQTLVQYEHETIGREQTCKHDDGRSSSLVLDPFAGAGTTGLVAAAHGRRFLGIELNAAYAELAWGRPQSKRMTERVG